MCNWILHWSNSILLHTDETYKTENQFFRILFQFYSHANGFTWMKIIFIIIQINFTLMVYNSWYYGKKLWFSHLPHNEKRGRQFSFQLRQKKLWASIIFWEACKKKNYFEHFDLFLHIWINFFLEYSEYFLEYSQCHLFSLWQSQMRWYVTFRC